MNSRQQPQSQPQPQPPLFIFITTQTVTIGWGLLPKRTSWPGRFFPVSNLTYSPQSAIWTVPQQWSCQYRHAGTRTVSKRMRVTACLSICFLATCSPDHFGAIACFHGRALWRTCDSVFAWDVFPPAWIFYFAINIVCNVYCKKI